MSSGSNPVKNIVLVGRIGNGKSATGNSLLKQEAFRSDTQPTGVTIKCQAFRALTKNGSIINVIDTPVEMVPRLTSIRKPRELAIRRLHSS
ncbi:unnamed protein product [Arabis nemorensis]|uniref:AIG1-type G domain-containing protein n=1 Tax=Arabis nemorensis TaxID=586526 RepID=A0A565CDR1_9BRAS|nr:unnamed protein product [Arabis nemorensis]